jgi:hypothetical protein
VCCCNPCAGRQRGVWHLHVGCGRPADAQHSHRRRGHQRADAELRCVARVAVTCALSSCVDRVCVSHGVAGTKIVVGEIIRTPEFGGNRLIGRASLWYTQLHNCGQMSTEHAAVLFKYQTTSNPTNYVVGSAFSYSLNFAVVAMNAKNLVLMDNVFHRTFRSSIRIDPTVCRVNVGAVRCGRRLPSWRCCMSQSNNATIDNNLVVGTVRSPDQFVIWIEPFAAFYIEAPVARCGVLVSWAWAAELRD